MSIVEQCSYTCRPLFEEAARAQYGEDPRVAGEKYAKALSALHRCLGLAAPIDPMQALTEVERWFSFFAWWYSARLLEENKPGEAWEILIDQAESFGPERSVELGIVADYGVERTTELYNETMSALELIQDGDFIRAAKHADRAADIQCRLAVERAGVPAPGTA